ncbi:hypothetical protein OTU49_008280 [Cherax quadricarinatus]|uniref:Adipose-secreted signaling protein n=1 Tax=Cherax quadricarinatus TaxID=27406 RepID=A0AAW0WC77_CHEQU|nr:UPF0687 protein C20orf27-like [Cherax quadricarinatus]XP_053655080.1 UPF0687 protein C20orf27-like [Cherax quadricarinatus]
MPIATMDKSGPNADVEMTVVSDDDTDKGHHVHFSEDTDELGNTAITIKEKAVGSDYEAHVGFLQLSHRYQISVILPLNDASDGYEIGDFRSVYCHAESLQEIKTGGLEVTFQLLAHKEKLMREKIILQRPTGGELKLTILARVLGKGKGTPMLRDCIKCISVEHDDESEASDWQGFT